MRLGAVARISAGLALASTLVFGATASANPTGKPPAVPVPPPGSVYASWTYTDQQLAAQVPRARPADVASPQAIVSALHAALDGPQGPWHSDRLRSLCLPNVLFANITKNDAGQPVVGNVSLADFIGEVQDVHNAGGWYERVTQIVHVSTVTKNGGALAVVDYQGVGSTTPNGTPVESGETQASLMFDGSRWWVVSDTW